MTDEADRLQAEAERPKRVQWADWLRCAPITDDPEGDFVADARRDPDFPKSVDGPHQLRAYLRSKGACPEAIEAVPDVWWRYVQWRAGKQ